MWASVYMWLKASFTAISGRGPVQKVSTQVTESNRTGINMDDVSVYLFPRAVITVRVQSHRLRFELLDDLMILIQQRHGHLVGATAVRPPAVPAG